MEMGVSDRLMAEFSMLEPLYVDGLAEVVNLGANVAMLFYRWAHSASGWEKMPAVNLIRPRASILDPVEFMQIVKYRTPPPAAEIRADFH